MAEVVLNVNGGTNAVDVDPDSPLLYVLMDACGLKGPKFGCGLAQCGACTVLMDGDPYHACTLPVSEAGKIVTLEGLGTIENPHPIQRAFIDHNPGGERVLTKTIPSPFYTGPLRSPNRLQNTFANESFIDEVAAGMRVDPVAYRLRHLVDSRLIDVLNGAARGAKWETRPSPKPGNAKTGAVTGRGVAIVLYEGNNGYGGMVAEVKVDQDSGRVAVTKMVVSNDSGPISNPDGLRAQMEGGALQGMSRAMFEEMQWNSESITSVDWRRFPVFKFGDPLPVVELVLIDRPDKEFMGAGETIITVVAAAIANAIFDATGARVRQVPFTPDRVLAALAARA